MSSRYKHDTRNHADPGAKMAGPRYTIAQTRARVAAMELAATHLIEAIHRDEIEEKQYHDVAEKLLNEAKRLKAKAQETRNSAK